jgi:hypothetical protein
MIVRMRGMTPPSKLRTAIASKGAEGNDAEPRPE